jgi:hypothetical protein
MFCLVVAITLLTANSKEIEGRTEELDFLESCSKEGEKCKTTRDCCPGKLLCQDGICEHRCLEKI